MSALAQMLMGSVGATTWTTAFSGSPTGGGGDYNGYTLVLVIQASSISGAGSSIRLTFKTPASGESLIDACYVGHVAGSGDSYDFDGNQVQIKVAGSGSFTLATGAADVVSDPATFAYDETKNLAIAFHFSGASNLSQVVNAGVAVNVKSATSEAATTNKTTGYLQTSSELWIVKTIEVR